MKIIAITQARYGSTRLPAKVLKKVGNKTLLDIHIQRILKSKLITKLIVATTNEEGSKRIIDIACQNGVDYYCGSVNDVLERFYFAVKNLMPDYVVRLTSDCPLIDSEIIDRLVSECIDDEIDYVSNTLKPTYPDGMDVEVFKFSVLERAYKEASLKSEREHVTPYIKKNSTFNGVNLFVSKNISAVSDYSDYRMTVDTQEDFNVIKNLIENVGENANWEQYVDYLNIHKDVRELNSNHTRDEGYVKSLLED